VGLSAVAEVVRNLGGVLHVDSQPGEGTSLSLSFLATAPERSS
jgi:signal transduction histidine kinase